MAKRRALGRNAIAPVFDLWNGTINKYECVYKELIRAKISGQMTRSYFEISKMNIILSLCIETDTDEFPFRRNEFETILIAVVCG